MPLDTSQHKKQEAPPPHDKLTKESTDSLLGHRFKNHVWKDLDLKYETGPDGKTNGYFKVTADNDGYSLSLIASRALSMRGLNPNDKAALQQEMDRIVALNVDQFKSLAKNRNFLGQGWKLKIWDDSVGPDAKTVWQPWKEAVDGARISVGRGERCIARSGSSVVVEPGGEARLEPGAKAFLAQDGRISAALPGSRIVAVGGEIHDFGATIIAPNPGDLRVIREDPAKLAALIKTESPANVVVKNDAPPPPAVRRPQTQIARNFYDKSTIPLPSFELYGEL